MEKETTDTHMPLLAVLYAELVFSCPHISKEQGKTKTILTRKLTAFCDNNMQSFTNPKHNSKFQCGRTTEHVQLA
jgi:hypothetical protein